MCPASLSSKQVEKASNVGESVADQQQGNFFITKHLLFRGPGIRFGTGTASTFSHILGIIDPNVVHVGDDLGAAEEQHLNQFASPVKRKNSDDNK